MRALIFTVLVATMAAGCSSGDPTRPSDEAVVVEVIDGDTVVLDTASGQESVRLLGIDTPETVHPTKPVECFGPEASDALKELLPPGEKVRLERDWEPRDRFGRLLAYIRRVDDDLFINLQLVVDGYADVLMIEPNLAYATELRGAVVAARASGVGRWSACPGGG